MTHTSTYRMKGLSTVAAYLAQMGTEIAEKMNAWLRDVLEPGETMPDVAFLFTLVGRKIGRALERLRELDSRLSRALTTLNVARRARDRAAEKMRGVLIHGRDLLDGCTRESAAPARFRGRISQRSHTAWLQAEAFLILLRDPGFSPVPLPGLLPYPKAELEESLAESMDEVERASQAVLRAEVEVKGARIRLKKDQAETARIHRWTLQLVQALSFLVDAPELVERLPPTLRQEAAKKSRRKKKKEPALSLESGPGSDLQPDSSLESGPESTLPPATTLESGPESILPPHTSEKSGSQSTLQVPQRLPGGNRRSAPPARGVTTREQPPVAPDTLQGTVETPVDGPPNAAAVRRNNDVYRLHVAPLRGNRRRLASVRGGDRAKRRLVASSRGVDRRSGGLEPPENGGFQALGPWKAKIFAMFGR